MHPLTDSLLIYFIRQKKVKKKWLREERIEGFKKSKYRCVVEICLNLCLRGETESFKASLVRLKFETVI